MTLPVHKAAPTQLSQLPRPANPKTTPRLVARMWQRSASPAGVTIRLACLISFAAALSTHTSLGVWAALALGIGCLVCLNSLVFVLPSARRGNSWAARACYGERIWMNRLAVPVPPEDVRPAIVLSVASMSGAAVLLAGAWMNSLLLAASGCAVYLAARLVFLDRMAALYVKMQSAHPLYRSWALRPDNDNSHRRRASGL